MVIQDFSGEVALFFLSLEWLSVRNWVGLRMVKESLGVPGPK